MPQRIAFIGTGIMGLPIAGHLLARSFDLVIHSRTRSKAAELEARGAKWADSPAEAARDADVVCICVTDTPDVDRVIFGQRGLIESARPGTVVIDHSTISPIETQRFAAELAGRRLQLLDAPLSGGDVGARNGALSIMVGGEKPAMDAVMPVLQAYGKTITHCGSPGAGQFTKLVNQVLVTGNLLAVCEALKFAAAAGLDLNTSIAATGGGAAASWQLLNLGPKIAGGDYKPGFMIELLMKDLRLLNEAAAAVQTSLPVNELVQTFFAQAHATGRGREGTQAVFEAVKMR